MWMKISPWTQGNEWEHNLTEIRGRKWDIRCQWRDNIQQKKMKNQLWELRKKWERRVKTVEKRRPFQRHPLQVGSSASRLWGEEWYSRDLSGMFLRATLWRGREESRASMGWNGALMQFSVSLGSPRSSFQEWIRQAKDLLGEIALIL